MKHLISSFLIAIVPFAALAGIHGQEGGGGSQTELDFVQIARFASLGISQSITNKEALFADFNLVDFNNAIGSVQIHQVDNLCTNTTNAETGAVEQSCLDAFYDPSINQINVSLATWNSKSCVEKMAIAVHEFGRASGNENSDYTYSSKVALSLYVSPQCIPYEAQTGVALPVNANVYQTVCTNQDCFKYGWNTSSTSGYKLSTTCKQGDCKKFGWFSIAGDGSTYNVDCLAGGCFQVGWQSVQIINALKLNDTVTCKSGDCLVNGWVVSTGYDLMSGGNVTCTNADCAHYGGSSFWRGRYSQTACYNSDCYHEGWSLVIY